MPIIKICSYKNCNNDSGEFSMCETHRIQRQQSDIRRKARRKSKGLCTRCGLEQALPQVNLCEECTKKKSKWGRSFRKRRIDENRCYICNNPLSEDDIDNRCYSCINKVRERSERRVSNGICSKCNNPKLENSTHCFSCWMKYKAYKHLGSRKYYKILCQLWEDQKGLCAYTKELLTPGVNAHLDHKTPISRNGNNEISNLHWIDKRINYLKNTHTHDEFIGSIPDTIRILETILNGYRDT